MTLLLNLADYWESDFQHWPQWPPVVVAPPPSWPTSPAPSHEAPADYESSRSWDVADSRPCCGHRIPDLLEVVEYPDLRRAIQLR
jgi:hypothetical protein